jgi:hypothetical protein
VLVPPGQDAGEFGARDRHLDGQTGLAEALDCLALVALGAVEVALHHRKCGTGTQQVCEYRMVCGQQFGKPLPCFSEQRQATVGVARPAGHQRGLPGRHRVFE